MKNMEQTNNKAIAKLSGFRRLGHNWNGYGCCAWYAGEESEEYIRQVASLLKELPCEVGISPLQNTHIVQIEFENTLWYVEFELNRNHTAKAYEQLYPSDRDCTYTCYWWEIQRLLKEGGNLGGA